MMSFVVASRDSLWKGGVIDVEVRVARDSDGSVYMADPDFEEGGGKENAAVGCMDDGVYAKVRLPSDGL